MSVHHTRAHFKAKYSGLLVDNPRIGTDLAQSYWQPGNSEMFLDVVAKLTGKPLSADAWVAVLNQPLGDKVRAPIDRHKWGQRAAVTWYGHSCRCGECVDIVDVVETSSQGGGGHLSSPLVPLCYCMHISALQLKEEQHDYEEALAKGPAMPPGAEPDLGMRIILAHGDEVCGGRWEGWCDLCEGAGGGGATWG